MKLIRFCEKKITCCIQLFTEPFSVKMQSVTCDNYGPWGKHALRHFADPDEAGQVCQFEVENLHATQWQFKEGFTCGNSAKRIVMCEKAFEVFKKVRRCGIHKISDSSFCILK